MRASLATSIAVACATVLALPVTLAAPATATARPAAAALPPTQDELPGSTQSLPLRPLGASVRSFGSDPGAAPEQGLTRRDVRPFSLVGVVWNDPAAVLHGTVQVRTRSAADGVWSPWQDVETHNDQHGADPATAEGAAGTLRGSTAPLWVGDSDGVEIRVQAERDEPGAERATVRLPAGLRLELVDPGEAPAAPAPGTPATALGTTPAALTPATAPGTAPATVPGTAPATVPGTPDTVPGTPATAPFTRAMAPPAVLTAAEAAASGVNSALAPYGSTVIPDALPEAGLDTIHGAPIQKEIVRKETTQEAEVQQAREAAAKEAAAEEAAAQAAKAPYIGPRPAIITRKGWGADESIREKGFVYTTTIKAAFVHHSATGNNYTCAQAPSVLRSIYRYHVKSSGWRDFGYNFAVDKCGNIYEGRAGGVAKAVLGAHTLGFNTNSMGVAVLGTFTSTNPPAAVVTAVARLTAWKLGLHGINPKGTVTLVSGGGNLYAKGKSVRFHAIAGHRDGFATECPGGRLYGKLGTARTSSAKYQGRS
ncbi:peptidoglycan recognition protein [Streptomyces sp. NPDC012421]|uniref:peptidoglycan recognition protein family protein n=1 Tax=Streptomyces sp. NPDC012421 TaxID=3364832 RepID=UPI0036EC3801